METLKNHDLKEKGDYVTLTLKKQYLLGLLWRLSRLGYLLAFHPSVGFRDGAGGGRCFAEEPPVKAPNVGSNCAETRKWHHLP